MVVGEMIALVRLEMAGMPGMEVRVVPGLPEVGQVEPGVMVAQRLALEMAELVAGVAMAGMGVVYRALMVRQLWVRVVRVVVVGTAGLEAELEVWEGPVEMVGTAVTERLADPAAGEEMVGRLEEPTGITAVLVVNYSARGADKRAASSCNRTSDRTAVQRCSAGGCSWVTSPNFN
jgi:hypothetical protein